MFEHRAPRRQSPGARVRVLVSGGTGFIGRAVTEALRRRDIDVGIMTRSPERARATVPEGIEIRQGDVTRPETLDPALRGFDTVVQCVQFPGFPVEAPALGRTFMKVDYAGTRAIVGVAAAAGIRKLVYVSGVGADPDSGRAWYRAKGLAEAAVRDSGLAWSIVRPSWVYGPGDISLNRFIDIIRRVPLIFPQIGPGTQRVSPLYIDDLGEILAEMTAGERADGAILEAGGPRVLTMDEIVRTAMRAIGREKPIVHVPLWLVRLGATLLEALPGRILSRDAVTFIAQDGVADPAELERTLPELRQRELEVGLAAYV